MKTIQLNKSSVELPDCWEDLSYKEKIFTFGILSELFAGTITPEIARLKMLIEYTGYRPSWIQLIKVSVMERDCITNDSNSHYSLYDIEVNSQSLTAISEYSASYIFEKLGEFLCPEEMAKFQKGGAE